MLTPRGLFFAVMILAIVLVVFPNVSMAQDDAPLLLLTDPMAPFLESRAVTAEKGATAEFRKMEWVAIDPVNNKLYVAMTEINQTMSDGEGAIPARGKQLWHRVRGRPRRELQYQQPETAHRGRSEVRRERREPLRRQQHLQPRQRVR